MLARVSIVVRDSRGKRDECEIRMMVRDTTPTTGGKESPCSPAMKSREPIDVRREEPYALKTAQKLRLERSWGLDRPLALGKGTVVAISFYVEFLSEFYSIL